MAVAAADNIGGSDYVLYYSRINSRGRNNDLIDSFSIAPCVVWQQSYDYDDCN